MPNQGVPVIFKNKIAYGYAEKSVQAYDVSVSDYNALTEQQQLDGSIRFIQGVDAIPNGSNVWAKLGTTPLAEGLPRDCSQAVNELKSNLTDLKACTLLWRGTPTSSSFEYTLSESIAHFKYICMVVAWDDNTNYSAYQIMPTPILQLSMGNNINTRVYLNNMQQNYFQLSKFVSNTSVLLERSNASVYGAIYGLERIG